MVGSQADWKFREDPGEARVHRRAGTDTILTG
jgi:hypothetical protein